MTNFVDKLFDRTVPGTTKAMDLTWKRNEAISSNIANAETPGYRAMDLNFAGELERAFREQSSQTAVKKTNARHMDLSSTGTAYFTQDLSGVTKADGNNVDLDIQMGKLTRNSSKYQTAASLVRKKLHMMRMAIRYAAR